MEMKTIELLNAIQKINNNIDSLARGFVIDKGKEHSYTVACRQSDLIDSIVKYLVASGESYGGRDIEKLYEKYAKAAEQKANVWTWVFEKKD